MKKILMAMFTLASIIYAITLQGADTNQSQVEDSMEARFLNQSYDADQLEETWLELDMPTPEKGKEERAKWIAKKKNQDRLLQKIKSQVMEGGLDFSGEVFSMLSDLEVALVKWNESYIYKEISELKEPVELRFECFACGGAKDEEELDEDELGERIQALREEENAHKDAAFDLIVQAGEEVMGAGGFAVAGMHVPAIIIGGKASYDLVEGCKEYNEGVRCQNEADALENEDDDNEEKSWWPFWK